MKSIEGQHGDVILEHIDCISSDAKKIDSSDGFVVERGEGIHTHTLSALHKSEENDAFEVWMINDDMIIKVKKPSVIDHEEHGKKVLQPGIYKKVIEREFDYEKEIERKVID